MPGRLNVVQQVGEQNRAEVVEGEGVFQTIGGDVPVRPESAHVVDQHVQPWIGVGHLAGQSVNASTAGYPTRPGCPPPRPRFGWRRGR